MQRRGRRQGGRGRGRRAVRILEPVLLLLLHHGPAHGYTFLERLEEFGLAYLDPSTVYRALRDLEEKGWVTSTWDEEQSRGPPRRIYRVTTLGDEALALRVQDLEESKRRIGYLLNRYQRQMEEGEGEHH
jgi:PadR family transcriptional regulator PadR